MSDKSANVRDLTERLASICTKYPIVQPQMIADVVRAVIDTLGGELSAHEKQLLGEVEDLGRTIAAAKADIAALREPNSADSNVSVASDELDAVVAHTAHATNAILEACELLDTAASTPGGPSLAAVTEATSRIYEACSFQDITGQRITKVVNTLKAVEAKVARIVETFGQTSWDTAALQPNLGRTQADSHLLNGPQLPAAAMAQADIDALLADF